MNGYVEGSPIARAIVEAWRPKFEIRYMTGAEIERLSAASDGTVFCG
jgi:hypothetical protein